MKQFLLRLDGQLVQCRCTASIALAYHFTVVVGQARTQTQFSTTLLVRLLWVLLLVLLCCCDCSSGGFNVFSWTTPILIRCHRLTCTTDGMSVLREMQIGRGWPCRRCSQVTTLHDMVAVDGGHDQSFQFIHLTCHRVHH